MKSTWVSTSQRTVPPIASGDELEARIRPEPAPDLCRRTTVGHDDIRGEVGRAADQRRADPVGVDGHAAALERPDLLRGETPRSHDLHAFEPVTVQRLPDFQDEPRIHVARIEVAHLVPERGGDEL